MEHISTESIIKKPELADLGIQKIEWVKQHMPILALLEKRFQAEKPFENLRICMSIHLEAKTARLALLLQAGGALVSVTGSNPLSTQDDVAAGLAAQGIRVCAWYGATDEEYKEHLLKALEVKPHLIIDDGGDLVQILHEQRKNLAEHVIGGCEETTTGVLRLRARAAAGQLNFPMVCVNDSQMKYLFDNRYGTGQSVWDGIMRTTNLIVAGKTVVVAGYGWCGKGIALRAKALGADVVVCEVNPVRAAEAHMDGHAVCNMDEAAAMGDIFITVTGCKDVIRVEHMRKMKDGAILCNAGHFDVEVAVSALEQASQQQRVVRNNIKEYTLTDGKRVYVIAEGRLVNLAAGDGHPAEIMDISFALQALSAEYMAKNARNLNKNQVYEVPENIDMSVARMKLETLGISIDALSDEQREYLAGWEG